MTQARGSQTRLALFQEATFATDPGSPAGVLLYIVSNSLAAQQNLLDSNTLTSTRARARPARGNIAVAGQLAMEMSAENMATIIKHALGANADTGADPYTHTATIGDLPVGLVLETDYGSALSTGRYNKFNGCRINSAEFQFPTEGYCTATFDIMGAKSTLGATPLDASVDDNGHTPFSSFQASIQEGGSSIATVTTANIKIDNQLDGNNYALGGAGQRRSVPEGFATISGTVTSLFEDVTLLNKAINDTASSLQITLSRGDGLGSSGNESIDFLVQQLVYELASPPIQGPQGLVATLNYRGYKSGSNYGLQIVTKNAIATA